MEQRIDCGLGIRRIRDSPRRDLKLPGQAAHRHGGLLDLLDLGLGADLFPELLQHLADRAAAWCRRHYELELDRLAVLLEQLLGLLGVELQPTVVGTLHPGAIAEWVAGGHAQT